MRLMDTYQVPTRLGTANAGPFVVVFPAGPVPDPGCPSLAVPPYPQWTAAPRGHRPGRPLPLMLLMLSCERVEP